MGDRAKRLVYLGDGSRWYQPIPARDLTEAETAALSDDRYAEVTGPQADGSPPLYGPAAAAAPTLRALTTTTTTTAPPKGAKATKGSQED